jgi:hypothetical protein
VTTFGPAAFLAKLEDDAPARARSIIDRVWRGSGNLTQAEADWLDQQEPGLAWPASKALTIAARDGQPVSTIKPEYLEP